LQISLEYCLQLEYLNLHDCKIQIYLPDHIQLQNIRKVNVGWYITEAILKNFICSSNSNLRSITVGLGSRLFDYTWQRILQPQHRIQKFKLYFSSISDGMFSIICTEHLRTIILDCCLGEFTDLGMCIIAEKAPFLEKFHCSGNSQVITDFGMIKLIDGCQ